MTRQVDNQDGGGVKEWGTLTAVCGGPTPARHL